MAYQPSFPYPYLSSVDANTDTGINFKCKINLRDEITSYKLTILKTEDNNTNENITIFSKTEVVGEVIDGVQCKTIDSLFNGSSSKENINISVTDTSLPMSCSREEDSWLIINIPTHLLNPTFVGYKGECYFLYNNCNFVWNIELTDSDGETIKSFDYTFNTRSTPVLSWSVPEIIDSNCYNFSAEYYQAEKTKLSYYQFDLLLDDELIASSGQVFSSAIKWSYDGFLPNKQYTITLTILTNDNVTLKNSLSFLVVYDFFRTSSSIGLSWTPESHCVSLNYDGATKINGVMEGSQIVALMKYANEEGLLPSQNNGIQLNNRQSLYWNKSNTQTLDLDNTTMLINWHNRNCFEREILSISDEQSISNDIHVFFDGLVFYYVSSVGGGSYQPFTNVVSAIVSNDDAIVIDKNTAYIINGNDDILSSDTLIGNDVTQNFWWLISIRDNIVDFMKTSEYKEV